MTRGCGKVWIAAAGCLLLTACVGASEPKVEKPEPAPPKEEEVELTAEDGLVLVGTYYAPKTEGDAKAPGVLLLHQMRGKRQDWSSLTRELLDRGYAVLAMDLRGHGESTKGKEGKIYNHRDFEVNEFPAMVGDAELALGYLREQKGVDSGRIGIVGASIGANAALNVAAKHAGVKSVVLLSPGIEYHMIKTEPAMKEFGGAVFLAASDEDRYSAETVRRLRSLCKGECELKIYSGAGHGTNMFRPTKGDLETRILSWIDKTLKE